MPVMLMPFLMTHNNCAGERPPATSFRSGGSGCNPSEYFSHFTPGAPWQLAQPALAYVLAPACTILLSPNEAGAFSVAWRLTDAVRTLVRAQVTGAGSSAVPATL